jgi:hypothetical protein
VEPVLRLAWPGPETVELLPRMKMPETPQMLRSWLEFETKGSALILLA